MMELLTKKYILVNVLANPAFILYKTILFIIRENIYILANPLNKLYIPQSLLDLELKYIYK